MKKMRFETPAYHHSKFVLRIAVLIACTLFCFQASHGQQWNTLGNEGQISSAAASYTSIAVIDSIPYVVYREGSAGKVKKRNASTGLWEPVGDNIGTNITYTKLFSDRNDSLFVTY